MSLKSFIALKDVRQKFGETFTKPKIGASGFLQVPPQTKNYGLVGQGFDYLLRFYLQRIYPFAVTKYWIADVAIVVPKVSLTNRQKQQAEQIVQNAKELVHRYLEHGQMTSELAKCALLLAQIDLLFRPGILVPNFGDAEEADVDDLLKLMGLVTPAVFQVQKLCLLNPTFGAASFSVGGADADLVMDDMLVEIKTTKRGTFERDHFNQLLGYYVLSRIDSIDNAPRGHKINRLGVYSARYGNLYTMNIDALATEVAMNEFIKWFEKRAKEAYPRTLIVRSG